MTMKNSKTIIKMLAIALLAGVGLSGCVAIPYGPPGYSPSPYYGQPAYSPPVVIAPWFGFYGGGRGYYGGRGRW